MPVVSRKEYIGVPRDRVENFDGKQLIYVSWDQHLLFAASFMLCLPPETPFREMVEKNVVALIGADPDAVKVEWEKVSWLKGNEPWKPDWDASLADNGIDHKTHLRFQTPGLNTVCG